MGFPGKMHSISVANVGSKGQIVIPADVREKLGVAPGDKVVILMRDNHAAVMLPMEGMRDWLDKMAADFDEIKDIIHQDSPLEKG
jgi:AbrB family looped-hinge helix DNA binding protein